MGLSLQVLGPFPKQYVSSVLLDKKCKNFCEEALFFTIFSCVLACLPFYLNNLK